MAGTSYTATDGARVVLVDHGDGTGTRTTYAPNGTITGTEQVTGLHIETADEANRRLILAALTQLIADAAAAKTTIASGRAALDTIRGRAQVSAANLTTLQAVQTDLKSVAAALDGLAAIDAGIIDRVVGLAQFTTADFTTPPA